MDRQSEVQRYVDELGLPYDPDDVEMMSCDLDKLAGRTEGCLSVGGSSVRCWIRLRLSRRIPPGCNADSMDHVTGVLHFWPWDVDRYGPQPTERCGSNIDTMRSPTWRLVDAKPVNVVAWRTAGKGYSK